MQAPAVALKFSAGRGAIDVCRQLKCFACFLWRGDEPKKFARFTPKVFLSAPRNIFYTAGGPLCYRRKNGSSRSRLLCFPQIGHHRLPRGKPFESVRRYGETSCPDVFAECEKRAMPSHIFTCRFYSLVDLDLLNDGVAFNIENAIGNQ